MSQVTDWDIANGTGAQVSADLNAVFGASVTMNSGSSEPSGTKYAYMLWADTNTGLLKQRNAANNAWIEIGTLASANLGLAKLGATTNTFTGEVIFSSTANVQIASGTTAQRPGSATAGDFRYNTTTNEFEGYSGSSPSWGSIGGGGGATGTGSDAIFLNYGQTVTGSYSIPANTNSLSAGPIAVASGQTVTIPSGSRWVIV